MRKHKKQYEEIYCRYKKYTIDEVRELWERSRSEYEKTGEYPVIFIDGDKKIKTSMGKKTSSNCRYDNFFLHGTDCVSCGLKGQYFWLEKNNDQKTKTWHFNLYGVDENGCEVQMTKDHIVPKSCGGENHIDNYQPMCCRCNLAKGNKQ